MSDALQNERKFLKSYVCMHLINANFRVVKQQRTTELEVLTDNIKKIKVSYPLGNNDHYIDVLNLKKS